MKLTTYEITTAYSFGIRDFSRANLRDANLTGANLTGANLFGTCLSTDNSVPYLSDTEITEAGLEIVGDRVYGYRTALSLRCGDTCYVIRDAPYVAPWFSTDSDTSCHPGIYLASKKWLAMSYSDRSLVRCYCMRSELVHAGDKWRCKRLWVVTE